MMSEKVINALKAVVESDDAALHLRVSCAEALKDMGVGPQQIVVHSIVSHFEERAKMRSALAYFGQEWISGRAVDEALWIGSECVLKPGQYGYDAAKLAYDYAQRAKEAAG